MTSELPKISVAETLADKIAAIKPGIAAGGDHAQMRGSADRRDRIVRHRAQ